MNEEIPGLTTINSEQQGEIKSIKITNLDQNNTKTKIIVQGQNPAGKPIQLKTIEVNLSNFFLYRTDFLNFFSSQANSNDYLKEISHNYLKNLIENSLQSFINNFKDKNKIEFSFTSNKKDYQINQENDYYIINTPFKITYGFKIKNGQSQISKNYLLVIKFKPSYVIFVSAFVDRTNQKYSIYGNGVMEVKELILK